MKLISLELILPHFVLSDNPIVLNFNDLMECVSRLHDAVLESESRRVILQMGQRRDAVSFGKQLISTG